MQTAKSKMKLCITEAKKTGIDGIITYYYSLPKISIFNFRGMWWLWKRLRAFKKNRIPGAKVIYN